MKLYEAYNPDAKHRNNPDIVGVEVEVEFNNDAIFNIPPINGWRITNDGSLRGGCEFITNPYEVKDTRSTLNTLFDTINKHNPIFSPRTSIHVHVNQLPYTLEEVWKNIFAALIMDDVLVSLRAKYRRNNRFCLPLTKSQSIIPAITSITDLSRFNRYPMPAFNANTCKYASTALHNLHGIGTLEFRSMEGTNDVDEIESWIKLCYETARLGLQFKSVKNIFDTMFEFTSDEEILNMYSKDTRKYLTKRLNYDMNSMVQKNLLLLYDAASSHTFEWSSTSTTKKKVMYVLR